MRLDEHTDILEPLNDRWEESVAFSPAGSGLRATSAAILILLLGTLLAHGWAVRDGLFLDDHLHVLRYRTPDFSWQRLLEDATVKPQEFIETWWQQKPIEWRYTRPFSILLGKLVYHFSGGSVKALHIISLVLHFSTAVMVYALAVLLTGKKFWASVAGLLFVVYSHSVYAVAWLAAQNSLLQTTLTVAALLAYAAASRLNLDAGRPRGFDAPPQRLRPGLFALALLLWGLALLSRENAVVLPVFAVAFDLSFGGWRQVRARLRPYVALAIIAGAFLLWRLVLAYHPMPDWYYRRPDGPEYPLWWLAKLLHFVTSAIWLSPMTIGPSGRFNPWREVPGDCVLMLAITGIMTTGYYLACRRARGHWIWPLWVLMTFLPVVPVMAAPHSGYMAGVGFALAMVLGPALRDRIQPVSIGRWSRPIALWFLIATCTYIPIYRAMWHSVNAAERLTMAGVAAMPPKQGATDVFFINLPFVNIYAQLHLAETLEDDSLKAASAAVDALLRPAYRAHVLTYAPDLLRMDRPCRLEQIDDYSFRLSIEGRPYFSGALGRYLIESMRTGGRMRAGETIQGTLCEVKILRADEEGVRELSFHFPEPLTSPRYCFYLCTNQCGAARVKFCKDEQPPGLVGSQPAPMDLAGVQEAAAGLDAGDSRAAEALFTAASKADTKVGLYAGSALQRVGGVVAAALAAPVQDVFTSARPSSADWARARSWWRRHVDDEVLTALWLRRDETEPMRQTREALYSIRQTASQVIQTDLYLTGPPYPSPR